MKPAKLAIQSAPLAVAIAAAMNLGCVTGPDTSDVTEAPATTAAAANPGSPGQRLEQASRKVDVGEGEKVAGDLAALKDDPAATPEQRDQAAMALARALEAKGDEAGAVKTLEGLISSRGNERNWPLQKPSEAALRRLLTGVETSPRSTTPTSVDAEPIAPFARTLPKYFPEEHGSIHVMIYGFGGSGRTSDRLGTFNVARAIREAKEAECPLCDSNLSIWTSRSRSDDWMGIIRSGAERGRGLDVYYFSLGDFHIPAHFDAELPMPVEEIDARLKRGEGLVVAKERPGAPPSILIAAPRSAQLGDVEEALAMMKTLPLEPVAITVSPRLRPDEIESVTRGSRAAQRACYAALVERSPGAEGSIKLKLSVNGDGTVGDVSSEPTASVRDPEFVECMEGVAKKLAFPATGHGATIDFPVRLAAAK
jgi:hypothetical protein